MMSRHAVGTAAVVAGLLALDHLAGPDTPIRYLLAALPILAVLALMTLAQWSSPRAGAAGWLVGLVVAVAAFGLTWDVFWVSQAKGLLLSAFVLGVLWPALLLYHLVNSVGGIHALARALQQLITDEGLLLIVVAWAFGGMLEGLAGFGLPIAIVAPILVRLNVQPVVAVAAVAVGHAWSVTFGDMGVIFETLTGLVSVDEIRLAQAAGLLLGLACVACGIGTARILGYGRKWRAVLILGVLMGVAQYALAVTRLTPLAAFGAGLAGILGAIALTRLRARHEPAAAPLDLPRTGLGAAILAYGSLSGVLALITLVEPLNDALRAVAWQASFPGVETRTGYAVPPGSGQVFRWLVHPGTAILFVTLVSYAAFRARGICAAGHWRPVLSASWRSARPAALGIFIMVGLAYLMDHTGMTLLIAEAMSRALQDVYPLAAPLVGVLGAFATGSNNNSNVLLAAVQENVAALLAIAPHLLLAAQTTGGSLGSMIAPAKIVVGTSTVGLRGRDGEVLRLTLPYGLVITLGVGLLVLFAALVA